MPRPSSGSSLRSPCSCVALFGLAIGVCLTTPDETARRARHRSRRRHRVRGNDPIVPRAPPHRSRRATSVCWPLVRRRSAALPRATAARPRAPRPQDRSGPAGWAATSSIPPSYCDGMLYVNTLRGRDVRDRRGDREVRWRRRVGGTLPSTPAIDGPRVIVSSQDGTVTALDRDEREAAVAGPNRRQGRVLPRRRGRHVYFGSTDGRLFAVALDTGRVRWAYDTGGADQREPFGLRRRASASRRTPARSSASTGDTGKELWTTYIKRDAFRYESFYASPSTDGARIYTVARSGKVVALDASRRPTSSGPRSVGGLGYTTPAVARRPGVRRAVSTVACARFARRRGSELWQTSVGGRILGAPVVIGDLVFFSTLEKRTYAAARLRRRDRLAAADGPLLARNRDRANVLLLAERAAPRGPRARRTEVVSSERRGCRRRHSGERWIAAAAAFQAASRAAYEPWPPGTRQVAACGRSRTRSRDRRADRLQSASNARASSVLISSASFARRRSAAGAAAVGGASPRRPPTPAKSSIAARTGAAANAQIASRPPQDRGRASSYRTSR